ncbi:MAG: hypothetical protein ACLR02_08200 [Clostridium sp.]
MIRHKGLYGINFFIMDIISIIDKGHIETVEKIEEEIFKKNVVNYICNKYSDIVEVPINENIYDIAKWNQELFGYSGYVEGNESSKYGIENNDNGLLLLLALLIDSIKDSIKDSE